MSNEILDNVEYILEGGALIHGGSRLVLLTPEALVDFQKSMERHLEADLVGQAIFEATRRFGAALAEQWQAEEPVEPEDQIRSLAHLCSQLGWGRIEITGSALGRGVLEFEVYHSAFAEAYRQAGAPVCHWIRGLYAGIWQTLLGCQVNGLETSCRTVESSGPCSFLFVAAEVNPLTAQVTPEE